MQKLGSEKINTPIDASQVCSNCGLQLNRVEKLSVANKKTFYNNPDGNLAVLEVLTAYHHLVEILSKKLPLFKLYFGGQQFHV